MNYNANFPHGLMFHRFGRLKNQKLGIGIIAKNDFEKIINFVGRDRILNPNEWIQKIKKRKLENHHLCITFDDGLKSQIDVALPVLNKYKIKAFWFLHSKIFFNNYDKNEIFSTLILKKFKKLENFANKFIHFCKLNSNFFKTKKFSDYFKRESNLYKFYSKSEHKYRYLRNVYFSKSKFELLIENFCITYNLNINKFSKNIWLNKKNIINLNRSGHMIGMHSFSHPFRMSNLSKSEQEIEYKKNYSCIKSICKKKIVSMSHPLNSYNRTTLKLLRKMGIICGFRANSHVDDGRKINPSYLELAREDSANILQQIK